MEEKTKGWLIFIGSFFGALGIVFLLSMSPLKDIKGLGIVIGLLVLPFMLVGYRMTENKSLGG